MAFTYHIALTGTAYTEFVPSNEVKITWSESGQDIFLRPAIEEIKIGKLLNSSLYDSLYAMFYDNAYFDSYVRFVIRRDGSDEYYFRSSISNGKIDHEKKIFLLAPEPDDLYQNVLDGIDKKFNESEIVLNVFTNDYFFYWDNPTNAFVNSVGSPFTAFTDSSKDVAWQYTGSGNNIARLAWTGLAAANDQIRILVSAATGGGYLRLVDSGFNPVSNTAAVTNGMKTLTATGTAAYVEFLVDAGTTGEFTYEAYSHRNNNEFAGNLKTVIDHLLGSFVLNTGITCKSTILFGDALPSVAPPYISSFLTAFPGKDYVTENKGPLVFDDNIMIGFADTFADVDGQEDNEFTLRDIFDIIRIKFQCYWYIDSDGYLRIEHLKYFRKFGSQLDLTSSTYAKFKPEVDSYTHTYNKGNIFNQFKYSENNAVNEDFVDIHVNYDIIKTTPRVLTVTPPSLSTDIAVGLTDVWSSSGFIMVVTSEINGTNVVTLKPGIIDTSAYYQNIELSWGWLSTHYWNWGCEADSAEISNGETLTAESIKEFLTQSGIRFYYGALLTWINPVVLSKGTGWIKKIDLSLESGFYTIDVGFNPYEDTGGSPSESITADSTIIAVDSTLITADSI